MADLDGQERVRLLRERYEEVKGRWHGDRFPSLMAMCEGLRYREWQQAQKELSNA